LLQWSDVRARWPPWPKFQAGKAIKDAESRTEFFRTHPSPLNSHQHRFLLAFSINTMMFTTTTRLVLTLVAAASVAKADFL
jgi:hypothetical protein